MTGIFQNDAELKDTLHAKTVADVFKQLKKEVDEYYGARECIAHIRRKKECFVSIVERIM